MPPTEPGQNPEVPTPTDAPVAQPGEAVAPEGRAVVDLSAAPVTLPEAPATPVDTAPDEPEPATEESEAANPVLTAADAEANDHELPAGGESTPESSEPSSPDTTAPAASEPMTWDHDDTAPQRAVVPAPGQQIQKRGDAVVIPHLSPAAEKVLGAHTDEVGRPDSSIDLEQAERLETLVSDLRSALDKGAEAQNDAEKAFDAIKRLLSEGPAADARHTISMMETGHQRTSTKYDPDNPDHVARRAAIENGKAMVAAAANSVAAQSDALRPAVNPEPSADLIEVPDDLQMNPEPPATPEAPQIITHVPPIENVTAPTDTEAGVRDVAIPPTEATEAPAEPPVEQAAPTDATEGTAPAEG